MNKLKRPWIALFSQTGTEIASVCSGLKILPDCIITTKKDLQDVNLWLVKQVKDKKVEIVFLSKQCDSQTYKNILMQYKNPLITMHGFLRIVPGDICDEYEIYNLHPGLITKYPELKGKDPQKRAIEGEYKTAGCVIHRAIAEVDAGEIIAEHELDIANKHEDLIFTNLRTLGIIMWKNFLKPYVESRNNQSNRNTVSRNLSGIS
jgi:folate-dependent phosphoribosylglycinamide formyltransferase PurN